MRATCPTATGTMVIRVRWLCTRPQMQFPRAPKQWLRVPSNPGLDALVAVAVVVESVLVFGVVVALVGVHGGIKPA